MILPVGTSRRAALAPVVEQLPSTGLVFDVDFRRYPSQPLPTTAASLRAHLHGSWPGTAPLASNVFTFAAASGDELDVTGSKLLTPVGTVLRSRRAVGLEGGSIGRWHRCAEWVEDQAGHFEAQAGTDYDPASASFGFLIVFRRAHRTPGQLTALLEKQGASQGWRVYFGINGDIKIEAKSGATITATCAFAKDEKAWHYLFVRVNRTAGQLQAFSDLASITDVSLAGVGSLTDNTAKLRIGQGAITTMAAGVQVAYFAYFGAAASEAMTAPHLSTWWRYGSAPRATMPSGTTFTGASHAGIVAAPIAIDDTEGEEVACWNNGQFPWGARLGVLPGGANGALCFPQITNLLAEAELHQWSSAGLSSKRDGAASPTGQTDATQADVDTVGNKYGIQVATVSGTTYTFSVWAKTNAAGVAAGQRSRLAYADAAFALIEGTAFDLSAKWRRLSITFTAIATGTQSVTVSGAEDLAAGTAWFWGAQLVVGKAAMPLVWSVGGSTSTPKTDIVFTGGANRIVTATQGRIVAEFASDVSDDTVARTVVDVIGSGNVNRRRVQIDASETVAFAAWDSAGSALTSASRASYDHNDAERLDAIWDSVSDLPGTTFNTRLVDQSDQTISDGNTNSWTATETLTALNIGQDSAGANQLVGVFKRLRSFSSVS